MEESNKILIVDDNSNNLRVLGEILEQAGFDVRPALSGEIALIAVEAEAPDLILLDIRMPGINGYETCRRLKENPATREIPVIFVSANEDLEDKLSAFDSGGVDYVVKPFQEKEVLVRVRTHIKLSKLEALHREILERQRVEKTLNENEIKHKVILANITDVISIIDANGKSKFFSPNLKKWFGWDPKQLIGLDFAQNIHPEDLKSLDRIFAATLVHFDNSETIECRYRCEDAEYKWIEFTVVNRVNVPEISGLLGSFHDISVRKEIEFENGRLGNLLQQAQKMESIGRLAGGIAHDFNNMLGVIMGHVELALMITDVKNSIHENLTEILNATNRSSALTKQLLAFARKQPINPKVIDLNTSLENIFKMLERLIGKDIQLDWKVEPGLGLVEIDPSQIDQILTNLCVNARDAIVGSGVIKIRTENKSFDSNYCINHPGYQSGEFVKLSVTDNGCGMDRETIAKIFEPFFTTKEIGKGTGLGLPSVFGIVKQNKGFIIIDSVPKEGTTFSIYLPINQEKAVSVISDLDENILRGGKETILVVEDSLDILNIITVVLELQGYSVLAASSSEAVVDFTLNQHEKIDLLLTDVMMPKMNGGELATQLLAINPNLKCLFMSGYADDSFVGNSGLIRITNFIQKPFSSAQLTNSVRKLLDA